MKKRNIIILFILTLIILFFTLKDNYVTILNSILRVNIVFLVLSYLLVLSYTFFKSIVTNNIVNKFSFVKFKDTFIIQLITFFFNAVTPFSSGGQPFQVYMFSKKNVSLIDSTNTILQETIIHQTSLCLIGILALVLNKIFNIVSIGSVISIFFIIGFLVNIIIVLFLLVVSKNEKLDLFFTNLIVNFISIFKKINKDEIKNKIKKYIKDFNNNSSMILNNKRNFILLVILNSIALICLYITPLTLLFSLGNYTSFDAITSIVIVTYVSIISSFVPLPGGTLGQEYIFATLFSAYLLDPMLSTLMILWRFITYYFPLIIGAVILNLKYKNIK